MKKKAMLSLTKTLNTCLGTNEGMDMAESDEDIAAHDEDPVVCRMHTLPVVALPVAQHYNEQFYQVIFRPYKCLINPTCQAADDMLRLTWGKGPK